MKNIHLKAPIRYSIYVYKSNMLSQNRIIFVDDATSKLMAIDKLKNPPFYHNFDIGSIGSTNIKNFSSHVNIIGGLILTFNGQVYIQKNIQWIQIDLPENIIKVSYESPFILALSVSKIYIIHANSIDKYSVGSFANDPIVDYIGHAHTMTVLTESGLIYQYDSTRMTYPAECSDTVTTYPAERSDTVTTYPAERSDTVTTYIPTHIVFDIKFEFIHYLMSNYVLAIGSDAQLYSISDNHCRRIIFNTENDFLFKPLCLSEIMHKNKPDGYIFRLYLFTASDEIIECNYCTSNQKCVVFHREFPLIDAIDVIDTPRGKIVVGANGRVYDLRHKKYIEYFDLHPVLGQNQKKSARCL